MVGARRSDRSVKLGELVVLLACRMQTVIRT